MLQGVSIFNFVVSLMFGASMQQLFGMVRTIQIIIWLGLISINLPGIVLVFLQGCMLIAQFDLFDIWWALEDYIKVRATDPYNQHFEFFGIGDMNFLFNSGSFFPFILFFFLSQMMGAMAQLIARSYPRVKFCRKIGIWTLNPNKR